MTCRRSQSHTKTNQTLHGTVLCHRKLLDSFHPPRPGSLNATSSLIFAPPSAPYKLDRSIGAESQCRVNVCTQLDTAMVMFGHVLQLSSMPLEKDVEIMLLTERWEEVALKRLLKKYVPPQLLA
jgi:hypothetical protein